MKTDYPTYSNRCCFKLIGLLFFTALLWSCSSAPPRRVLVFSKTAGFHHESIDVGIAAIQKFGQQHHFAVDTTKDSTQFNSENLRQYGVVIFLNTTGNVLNPAQQEAFEKFIHGGGGFVGVHAAADTEYDWPWYGKLVGAYFERLLF